MKSIEQALVIPIILIVFCLSVFGCSNSSNPLTPGEPDNPIEVSNSADASVLTDTRNVLGAWTVNVSPDNLTAEVIPARSASTIGDIFDADLYQFLTVNPCTNCLNVTRVFLDGYGDLCLKVAMKHPFNNIDTRPDLHGFDVRGIIIADQNGDQTFTDIKVMRPGGTEESAGIGSPSLNILNADGYTSHYDELVNDTRYFFNGIDMEGNLNPFFRFFESYGSQPFDPFLPHGHNVMPVASMNYSRTAVFDKSSLESDFTFYIVADVAYGHSATYLNRTDPQYYLPAYNRTEAWRVEYWIENNNLSYSDDTSSADVVVQVFDWQQGATVDPEYPTPGQLDSIPETSDVAQVELSIPSLQNAPIIVNAPESGQGTEDDPLQYRLRVVNENGYGISTCWGLLAVRDTLYGQAEPHGRLSVPETASGFPYDTLDIVDYAIYSPVFINVIGTHMVMFSPYLNYQNEMTIHKDYLFAKYGKTTLKPDFFMDPSHRKFRYDWDYDYDGVVFDAEGSGLPSEELEYNKGGEHNIGLRVSTNSVPNQEYVYTIPVWAEGLSFQNTLENASTIVDAASGRMSHAVAVTTDNYYAVTSHHKNNERNVWLSIGDKDGNFTTQSLTGTTGFFTDPCMVVIESGSNAGIYVAYSDQNANALIYTTKGNLDGSGFTSPVRISTGSPLLELYPVLLYHNNQLICYYVSASLTDSYIYASHSTNMGDSWSNDGWIMDNGSDDQTWPTAVSSGEKAYLLWEEEDTFILGDEIFMAESSDGINFPDYNSAVGFFNNEEEIKPCASFYRSQLAYTYLKYPHGLPDETNTVLSVYNTSEGSILSYPISTRNDMKHTYPSIGTASEGDFIVAYGAYDTAAENMYQVVLNIQSLDAAGAFTESAIINEATGSLLPLSANGVFCGVACRAPLGGVAVAENFIVFTKFNNGNYDAGDFRAYGQIDRLGVYTERDFLFY